MNSSVKEFFSHKEDYHPKNRLAYEIYTNFKFLIWSLIPAAIYLFFDTVNRYDDWWVEEFFNRLFDFDETFLEAVLWIFAVIAFGRYFILLRKWVLKNK